MKNVDNNNTNKDSTAKCIYTLIKTPYTKYVSSCGYNLGLHASWTYCPNCGKEIEVKKNV